MNYCPKWVLLLIFFSVQQIVYAQIFDDGTEDLEELYGDEEWIAISTGTKKPIYRAPAVANVITEDDIKKMGATTLDEILEAVPGMHVGFSLPPASSLYVIRGFGGKFNSQVLTLINGTPIDTALDGGRPNAYRMPVANIARIEIIRGPGSAVYGADAYAGVINIITKDTESNPGTQTGIRFGAFNLKEFWFTQGNKIADWDIYFGLDYQTYDGDEDRIIDSDLQSQLDALFGTSASLAPSALDTNYEVADLRLNISKNHWQIRFAHLDISDAGQGAGVAQALDHTGLINSNLTTADLSYHSEEIAKNWDLTVSLSINQLDGKPDFQILPPGAVVPIGEDGNLFTAPSPNCPLIGGAPLCIVAFTDGILGNPYMEEDHTRFEVIGIYGGVKDHRIRASVGYKNQDLHVMSTQNFGPGVIDGTIMVIDGTLTNVTDTPNIYIEDGGQSRTISFLSIQDEWTVSNDWELTTGIRYDDYSDFGSTVNPRLALVWQTNYNLTTKLLYGKAFRAPSFSDQFAQNNPITLGNSTLDPETIDTLELVFDYRPTLDSQIIFNTFTYDADDLILFVPDLNGTFTAQNTDGQEGKGFEIEASYKTENNFKLYGNFSWLSVTDKITNQDVADVPTRQLYFRAIWDLNPSWTFSSQLNRVGGRTRLSSDTRDNLEDYTTLDFTARGKNIYKKLNITISLRNALDEDAKDPSSGPMPSIPGDFPLPGRSYFIETSLNF